ncbi:MAG: PHA/PHB synthase family protein [Rudaea sp.]
MAGAAPDASVPNPYALEPWVDLGLRWQQMLQTWTQWWLGQGTWPSPAGAPPMHAPAAGGPFDAGAIAALNASFEPRLRALWEAAHAAATQKGAIPDVATEPAGDRRFTSPAWREQPYFAWLKQAYLLYGEYLEALAALAKLPPSEKRRLQFSVRQFVEAMAPTNFPATNPDVLRRAIETEGASLVQGLRHLMHDAAKGRITMSDETAFEVGRNLAVTPGSVVFRNPLIELIQYDASTSRVAKRPLLMVPPCINKYYILDLRPENSFVRHAVAHGHTVFMISWRNVPAELGRLTWDDYLQQGVLAAMEAVKAIARSREMNVLGFCVGGTLLACALAVLAARNDATAASVTFLTTMLDFEDPGEIAVYVTPEMLAAREPALFAGQRVHGSELAGAFASLRPNELVWNYVVNNYLRGATPPAFDLLYWNGDSANLPGPMYAYYIRNMYLDNRLREPGSLTMLGERIDLSRVTAPAYVYASREDHIVPWRSAYRTLGLIGGAKTFVLGASGHIAGVVNPPQPPKRNHWTSDALPESPDAWLEAASSDPGSWWPDWWRFLDAHRGGERAAPKHAGSAKFPPLDPAPGRYVREEVA